MKAVFLDRDGTIIVEPPRERLTWVHDIKLFPETVPALKLLIDNGFALIEITNQAAIGEGLITPEQFWDMEIGGLEAELAKEGIRITKTYVCPHVPSDNCACRKPKPKMILDAAEEFKVNLADTFMVGDNISDVGAGINAGAKTILVKTAMHNIEAPDATFTAANLLEAAQYIVEHG